jgi:hypothetical protein
VSVGIASAALDARTASLVYQHRVGLGRHLSVGVTRARDSDGHATRRSGEVFVKAAFER